jgi:hypothetical protein
MLNHPTLKDHVGQNDEECLMHLNEVDVQEIDDDTFQVQSQALTLISILRATDTDASCEVELRCQEWPTQTPRHHDATCCDR